MQKIVGVFLLTLVLFACRSKKSYTIWGHYKGSPENIHYSSLTGIDTTNVKRLQGTWWYHTSIADTAHHSQIQCNPMVVDGWLYGTTPQMQLFALDAATGKEKGVSNRSILPGPLMPKTGCSLSSITAGAWHTCRMEKKTSGFLHRRITPLLHQCYYRSSS